MNTAYTYRTSNLSLLCIYTYARKCFFSFQITQSELQAFVTNMGKVDMLASGGIRVGGDKYM